MLPGNGGETGKNGSGDSKYTSRPRAEPAFSAGSTGAFPCENEDESPTQNLAGKRINMAAGIFTILRHSEQRFELKNSEFYCEINF